MRPRSLIGTTALLAGLALAAGYGCSSSNSNNNGGSGGTASGGMGGEAAGGMGGSAGGASGTVTYANAAMAVFVAKCTPCHTKTGSAAIVGHTLASSDADAKKPSNACPGKKKGECALERVKNGMMPQGKGCTGDPTMDSANMACLTAAEIKVLEDWVAGGLQ